MSDPDAVTAIWITDDWSSEDESLHEGIWAVTALRWVTGYAWMVGDEVRAEWQRRIRDELLSGGGAFEVTEEFWDWQLGLPV